MSFLLSLLFVSFALGLKDPATLDLSRFIGKLMKDRPEFFPNVSVCESAIGEYTKFLTLIQLHKDIDFTPSRIVDEVWHSHILDTRAYMKDCKDVFGHYLHHNPGFETSEKSAEHQVFMDQYNQTLTLYKQQFGHEAPFGFWPRRAHQKDGCSSCDMGGCGSCTGTTDAAADCSGCGSGDCGAKKAQVGDTAADCSSCGSGDCGAKKAQVGDTAASCGSGCGSASCGGAKKVAKKAQVGDTAASCGSSCGSAGCGLAKKAQVGDTAASCGSSCGSAGCGGAKKLKVGDTAASCGSSCGSAGCGGAKKAAKQAQVGDTAASCGSSCGSAGCGGAKKVKAEVA